MAPFDITPISLFFLAFASVYLVALAYLGLVERRRQRDEAESTSHMFSLVVPAHDEQNVIDDCISALLALDYPPDQFETIIVDDGSSDLTAARVRAKLERHSGRIAMLQIPREQGARGKANALNHAFQVLRETSRFRGHPSWIVGVFDADGQPDRDMLKKASFQFLSPGVGGVQSSVRIRNRDRSWLTRMQDIEFAGFSRVTQIIRTRITNSAALGGNGQFVRASAIEQIAIDAANGVYWDPDALTEDLELSTRLVLRNWDLHHLNTSFVWQEGVETTRALMRQRTRWAWGSLQVFFEFVLGLKVLRAPNVRLRKRLDLLFNLSIFLVSPLIFATWILTVLAFIGLATVLSSLPTVMMIFLSFAYLPVVGYGLATLGEYRRLRLPLDLIGFAIYTYHWVPCLYAGLWHLAARHGPTWWKTLRNGETPAG